MRLTQLIQNKMNILKANNKPCQNSKFDAIESLKLLPTHTFHIPVMGLAFTVDSPIKVARFGISSVISIIEDRLMEMMRAHYYPTIEMPYEPISIQEPDYRAKRITDYLNLVQMIVQKQMHKLKGEAFEISNDIAKYFEKIGRAHV